MKLLVVLPLLLASVLAFPSKELHDEVKYIEHRITGGEVAKPHEFPYTVGIYTTIPAEYDFMPDIHTWCGASLISEEWVITAGHCVYKVPSAVLFIGAHNILDSSEKRLLLPVTSKDFISHPKYDHDISLNDIALIKLPIKVKFSDKIQKINLPKPTEEYKNLVGRMTTISGWGKTGDDEESSDVLRFVQLRVLENKACKSKFPYHFVDSVMLCLDGSNMKSACPGDSGGPLVIEEKDGSKTLVGLTSFGKQYCQIEFPSVFTKVAAFTDWISKTTGIKI